MTAYRRNRRVVGIDPVVDATRARRALDALRERGFSAKEIAYLLGATGTDGVRVRFGRSGKRCRRSVQRRLEALLERARRGEVEPAGVPSSAALGVRADVAELLELRRRGVRLVPGALLEAELGELRRMRRAS